MTERVKERQKKEGLKDKDGQKEAERRTLGVFDLLSTVHGWQIIELLIIILVLPTTPHEQRQS